MIDIFRIKCVAFQMDGCMAQTPNERWRGRILRYEMRDIYGSRQRKVRFAVVETDAGEVVDHVAQPTDMIMASELDPARFDLRDADLVFLS